PQSRGGVVPARARDAAGLCRCALQPGGCARQERPERSRGPSLAALSGARSRQPVGADRAVASRGRRWRGDGRMRVLLIGGGGREHALAWKLAQSPRLHDLIAAPGHPGIAAHARCVAVQDTAIDALLALARRERVDLTVVGPEIPLALGLADRFRDEGLHVFGPSRAAARLESSKAFAKAFMARHDIPTARFQVFTDADAARHYCRALGAPVVVKADGLAGGKGALVCKTLSEADRAVGACLGDRRFGAAGASI